MDGEQIKFLRKTKISLKNHKNTRMYFFSRPKIDLFAKIRLIFFKKLKA